MTLYMLDTDMASYLIRGDHPEVTEAFRSNFAQLCMSSITAAELLYGAKKRNSSPLTHKVQAMINLVPIVDWSKEAACVYADLRTELESAGTPIGSMDMLIAAAAIAEKTTLVTNNTEHFARISQLTIENWLA